MTWKVDMYNRVGRHWIVKHCESGTTFEVKLEGQRPSEAQAHLIPPAGKALPWTGTALEEVERELQEAFEAEWAKERRRFRLQEFVQTKFGGDTYYAASVLSRTSGRNVSPRSVQAWLIELNRRSSRPCPQWVLDALESYHPTVKPQDISADFDRYLLQNTLRRAEEKLQGEENWRKKLETTPLSELGKRFADRDIFLTRSIVKLEDELRTFTSALRNSQTYEEFKAQFREEREKYDIRRFTIEEDARVLRDGQEEFSNPDGLPESGCK